MNGVDLTTVDQSTWETLGTLFVEHHVLVFLDQDLTLEDQLAFARLRGPLVRHPYAGMVEHPELIELVNRGKERDFNQHWHSDMTHETAAPKLTMLHEKSVPSVGGDTAFANHELAYEGLSDGLRPDPRPLAGRALRRGRRPCPRCRRLSGSSSSARCSTDPPGTPNHVREPEARSA
ncbi:MAG TPA: TauD/TfdA family dioxygenase [Acidimicrobiales bacterium]|nr:TauD/TfdA family dioxygenase [Acidimicrobiales bacterium]